MPVKKKLIFFILLSAAVYVCFSQHSVHIRGVDAYQRADQLYDSADRLAEDTSKEQLQDDLNRRALILFREVINSRGTADSILVQAYVKSGLICQYFDSIPLAQQYYSAALNLRKTMPGLADSFFFKPALFTGGICYNHGQFDSALLYYRQAEQISDQYDPPPQESERLYNRLGAMYYESGNYILAGDYFQKALTLLSPANPSYRNLLINFKINIAVVAVKSGEYQKAADLFRQVLPFKAHLNEIYHNLGIIGIRTGNYAEAVSFFRQVEYDHNPMSVELYFNMAEAFSALQHKDSADHYLKKAFAENEQINGNRKNISAGMLHKFIGDEQMKAGDAAAALSAYQQALQETYSAYKDTSLKSEPKNYSGVIAFTQLFNILIAKAEAFEKLYAGTKSLTDLEAAFTAYRAAFDLADHIAKTYNSDEARIFLNKSKYEVHDQAIENSILLYQLTQKKYYLEQAYIFDQQNKASALTLALQENTIIRQIGTAHALIDRRDSLRSVITRLTLKAGRETNPVLSDSLNNRITENDISLAKTEEQIDRDPAYSLASSAITIPSLEKLQDMLDDNTALLSYHLSEKGLLVFCIRRGSFDYIRQQTDTNFRLQIHSLFTALYDRDPAQRYAGTASASYLYNILVRPVLPYTGDCKRMVIIPDDELNDIPFEALQDEHRNYLVQTYAVQYQFSSALLQLQGKNHAQNSGVLAFAPFADSIQGSSFKALPYSKEEVAGLQGKVLQGAEATKEQFIAHANQYRTVQLATHAAANDSFPAQSFVAFYPKPADSTADHMLYAREIYNLNLDSTDLVILSACETGRGNLVRGEGLMSITRAFSYAGCPNIITSLWKATDKTTAFITQRLHYYLDKGYSKDHALQAAKIDLLNSDDISPELKTPDYWANLVFIGDYEPAHKGFRAWWIFAVLAMIPIWRLLLRSGLRKPKVE